jgi:hypothetical protein
VTRPEELANSVDLRDDEREWIGFMLADALMPYGKDFDPAEAARIIEGRIGALLAARGERGYRQGWTARADNEQRIERVKRGFCYALDCDRKPGHMGPHSGDLS